MQETHLDGLSGLPLQNLIEPAQRAVPAVGVGLARFLRGKERVRDRDFGLIAFPPKLDRDEGLADVHSGGRTSLHSPAATCSPPSSDFIATRNLPPTRRSSSAAGTVKSPPPPSHFLISSGSVHARKIISLGTGNVRWMETAASRAACPRAIAPPPPPRLGWFPGIRPARPDASPRIGCNGESNRPRLSGASRSTAHHTPAGKEMHPTGKSP